MRAGGRPAMEHCTGIGDACGRGSWYAASTYAIKCLGQALPARWLRSPRMPRVAGALTVALLASLTVMNTFANGTTLALDARLAALATAALALALRLPFLLVVLLGAAAAALVRGLS